MLEDEKVSNTVVRRLAVQARIGSLYYEQARTGQIGERLNGMLYRLNRGTG